MQNVHILLAFLWMTLVLLLAVSIYCYLLKYQSKKSLPFHYASYESWEFYIYKCIIKMSNSKTKVIDIKNRTYYFFNDMLNAKNFDAKRCLFTLWIYDDKRFEIS